MTKKRGRPLKDKSKKEIYINEKETNTEIKTQNPLYKAINILRLLHKQGKIHTLTEQSHIINTNYQYTYISFKIPINKNQKINKINENENHY